MKTIHKYPLAITDTQKVPWRAFAAPVLVGLDPQGDPCIWLSIDTEVEQYDRIIYMVGTGREIPAESSVHIGSFVWGRFVWHIFI